MSVDLPMPSAIAAPQAPNSCSSCALSQVQLSHAGVDLENCDRVIALAGNPNTGKSTVFNALTGMRQHVGNWPGSTVTRAEGGYAFDDLSYKVVDLPGTYSLLSNSRDEDVARDYLLFSDPDVAVVVVDPTRLERNLNLVLQILQITSRVVVAVNLIDEAKRYGIEVDIRHLSRELAVPVVPMVARRGEGVSELVRAIAEVASSSAVRSKPRQAHLDPAIADAVDQLAAALDREYPGLTNARWVALRLLEGDRGTERAIRDGQLRLLARQHQARAAS